MLYRESRKGQVAAEFMLYMAVFMVLVVVAYLVINNVQSSELPQKENTLALESGQNFLGVFSLSVRGGSGFSYSYVFPQTILGVPYYLNFSRADAKKEFTFEWPGPYGNFSHQYTLPNYAYRFHGCLSDYELISNNCSNTLVFTNDGENLTINQGG